MIGPVVKVDPDRLPRAANIHWLGQRDYAELPAYMAGWDVALMPFAHNAATRFISPTKTPEYLAAGLPGGLDAGARRGAQLWRASRAVRIAEGARRLRRRLRRRDRRGQGARGLARGATRPSPASPGTRPRPAMAALLDAAVARKAAGARRRRQRRRAPRTPDPPALRRRGRRRGLRRIGDRRAAWPRPRASGSLSATPAPCRRQRL